MTSSPGRPDVAVVVPVYNRLRLLKDTVESLRAQTLQSAEFILVDDHSDLVTATYLDTLPVVDARFRILRKPPEMPRGGQASRNWGLECCTAEAVVFLDSDDLLGPACLAERFDQLKLNPAADIVVGRQAILNEPAGTIRWVNVHRDGVNDLDRFLDLAAPLDVPWVTGGALFRRVRLNESGARWIPHLLWQDAVFHIQCLLAGLSVVWMQDGEPDSFYRQHGEDHFGRILMTADGMRGIVDVLSWIRHGLVSMGQMTEQRLNKLEKAFFHTCVLRAIDAGETRLAGELIERAVARQLLELSTTAKVRIYLAGRRATAPSSRATYYWNRLCEHVILGPFFPPGRSTYGTEQLGPGAEARLLASLGSDVRPDLDPLMLNR